MRVFTYKQILSLVLPIVTGLSLANPVHAQTVANWAFSNNLTASIGTNNTASNSVLSPAIPTAAFNGGNLYYGQGGWPAGTTINTNAYLEFSVTPNAGHQIHLQSVELIIRRSNLGTPSGGGPRAWALRSSLDNYTDNLGTGSIAIANSTHTINLGTEFIYQSNTITFRLYGYDVHVNPGSENRFVFDNIRISGLSILPIKFNEISVHMEKSLPVVKWAVGSGEASNYTVERSTDGKVFSEVAVVKGDNKLQYTAEDRFLNKDIAKLYYRVKATLRNGEVLYSDIVTLFQTTEQKLTIKSLTSQQSKLQANIFSPEAAPAVIRIVNSQGIVTLQQTLPLSKGLQEISLYNIQGVGISTLVVTTSKELVSKQFLQQ